MPKSSCAICRKTWATEGIHMFHTPKDQIRLDKWIEACGVALTHNSKVCELHFTQNDFGENISIRRRLNKDAMPMGVNVWDALFNSTETRSKISPDAFGCVAISEQNIQRVLLEAENDVNFVGNKGYTVPVVQDQNQIRVLHEPPTKDNILNRLNMIMLPAVPQAERPHAPDQYVKMHTFSVFVKHQEGYIVAVDKILSAEDPLDVEKFKPMYWMKPIEPELSMDVQVIESKNYGDVSSDDGLGDVELSDSGEVNSAHEESIASERDVDWQVPAKKRGGEVGQGETKKLKLSQAQMQSSNVTTGLEQFKQFLNTRSRQPNDNLSNNAARVEEPFEISDSEAESHDVVKDAILEHLAATVLKKSFSLLLLKNSKVAGRKTKVSKAKSAENIVTPDEPRDAEVDDGSLFGTAIESTPSDDPSIAKVDDGGQIAFPHNTKADFADLQRQQRPSENFATKEVAQAESWQQVIEAITKDRQTSAVGSVNLAAIGKAKDKSAAAAKDTNDQRKKVGGPGEKNVNGTKTVTVTFAATARHQQAINAIGCVPANRLLTNPNRLLNTTKNCVLENQPNAGLGDTSTLNASCILGCDTFHKLYTFPSAQTDPQRRHFWFLKLRRKLAANWHKSLYICENHFEKSMFTENSLHKYAYPCKGLRHILKVPRRKAVNETKRNAIEQHNYEGLLSELTELQELEYRQAKEINQIKVFIRSNQEAMRWS